jgi:NADPH2:quinone reductase
MVDPAPGGAPLRRQSDAAPPAPPRAIICRSLGAPETLSLEAMPPRALQPGEARVRIAASGVNFFDTLIIAGRYQYRPPLPFTPGVESAGTISELAPDVTGWQIGDRVITRQRLGGYAEEIVLAAGGLVPLPKGWSFAEGATFLAAAQTAHHALAERGDMQRGEVLLVLGAGGGMGLAAVELGALMGGTVIAAASSAEKLAAAERRGARHLVPYSKAPLAETVRELTGGAGADVIFDPVGGAATSEALRAIAWGGRLLAVGFAAGEIPALPLNRILLKGCSVVGVRAGEAARRDPAAAQAALSALLAHARDGHLKPHVSRILPLARCAEAMRLLSDRQAIGRVALAMET